MKIDFKEIIPLIDISDLPEGKFEREYKLPDGRSIEIKGRVEIHGSRIHNYSDPDDSGYFNGTVEFTLTDWSGFGPDGSEISVQNYAYFQNRIQSLIQESI
jgi:hypothetical protein